MAQRSFPNAEKTNGAVRPIATALLYVLVAGICSLALPQLAKHLDLAATYPVTGALQSFFILISGYLLYELLRSRARRPQEGGARPGDRVTAGKLFRSDRGGNGRSQCR